MKRILILRAGALGDFILTVPAIKAVRKAFPSVLIHLAGRDFIAGLALASGLADKFTSIDSGRAAAWHDPSRAPSKQDRQWAGSFDLALNFLHDPDRAYENGLLRTGMRRVLNISPIMGEVHAARHFLAPLVGVGLVEAQEPAPGLELGVATVENGCEWLKKRGIEPGAIAIHPGSGSRKKNWPAARFVQLARRIYSFFGRKPALFIGEADGDTFAELNAAGITGFAEVCSGMDVLGLALALAACGVYIGNDSGATHLAAALGVSTIALFGPTRPEIWGPLGKRVEIIRSSTGGMADISIETAWRGVERAMGWTQPRWG